LIEQILCAAFCIGVLTLLVFNRMLMSKMRADFKKHYRVDYKLKAYLLSALIKQTKTVLDLREKLKK
jgi:hypothetical protein